jgi:short-subunit dehydrogenase
MAYHIMITGATGGLGKAFTVECANRGWDLFLTDLSEDHLEILAKSLEQTYGIRVRYLACDLTDQVSRESLFTHLRERGHRFNMLINIAGVDFEGLFGDISRDQIRTILRLNIESTMEVTHALLQMTDPIHSFRIVNVSSMAAFYPMPVKATYAASKRFLLDFSIALRQELKGQGGTVTVLCPAGMPTNSACIEAIDAQGIMGQLTTINVGTVAHKTIDKALEGRSVYIPGILNQFIHWAGNLIPSGNLAALIDQRWKSAHEKRGLAVHSG